MAILASAAVLLGPPLLDELEISGTDTVALTSESAGVAEAIERGAEVSGQSVGVLVPLYWGPRDRRTRARITHIALAIAQIQDVAAVNTFIGTFTRNERFLQEKIDDDFVSVDRSWTHFSVLFDGEASASQQLVRLREQLASFPGIKLGGATVLIADLTKAVREDLRLGEAISLPVLLLVLLWFFRRPSLAMLPLIVGLITLTESLVCLRLLHQAGLDLSLLAIAPVAGLALGLSVDYNLLFVTRYREEYERSRMVRNATLTTLQAVSPTVSMSAVAILFALLPLALFPIRLLFSISLGAGLCAVLAAVNTLLIVPVALFLLGDRLGTVTADGRRSIGNRRIRTHFWRVVPRFAVKHPRVTSLVAAGGLIAVSIPALSAQIGAVDSTDLVVASEGADVSNILETRFRPVVTSERYIVLVGVQQDGTRGVQSVEREIRRLRGIRQVRPAASVLQGFWSLQVTGNSGVGSAESRRLVSEIRGIPTNGPLYVTSPSASIVDREASLRSKFLLVFLCSAVGLYVALILLTGSIVIPLKMMLLNIVTLGATLGLLTLIFQGWEPSSEVAIFDSGQIIALIVISIALTTDYGVFVVARIIEGHNEGRGDDESIALGLERTGPVVSAAAVVFCVAVGGFVASDIAVIREMCVGMILAVLIDASIVRALLIPALMTWLGPYNWWMPARLEAVRRWIVE